MTAASPSAVFAAAALWAAGIAPLAGETVEPPAPVDRPNLLVIMLDDLDYGTLARIAYGGDDLGRLFPGIRRLTEEGTFATRFFSNSAVCCASRATFLLGTHSSVNGVWSNSPGEYFAPDPLAAEPPTGGGYPEFRRRGHEPNTIAAHLDPAYRTIAAGKYLNHYRPEPGADAVDHACRRPGRAVSVPPHWNGWLGLVRRGDADHSNGYSDFEANRNGCMIHRSSRDPELFLRTLRAFVADEIDRAARNRVPFFAFVAPPNPHSITNVDGVEQTDKWVDARHLAAVAGVAANAGACPPLGPTRLCVGRRSIDEARIGGLGDKPPWVREAQSPGGSRRRDAVFHRRLASLRSFDETLAGLLDDLGDRGVLDETVVVLTSDQGFRLGQHGLRNGKNSPYDEDLHVPLIVRGPGFEAMRRRHAMFSMIDLHATLLDLAGVDAPSAGRSVLDDLRDGGAGVPYVYAEGVRGTRFDVARMGKPMIRFQVVRDPRWKFVWTTRLNVEGKPIRGSDFYEWYDLVADPAELEAIVPSAPTIRAYRGLIERCRRGACPRFVQRGEGLKVA